MVMRVQRSIVVIDIFNRGNLMASSSGSLSVIQFRDLAEMMAVNRKFISTIFFGHSPGAAAMVRRPRGVKAALLRMNLRAYLKLQKVAGYSG